MNPKCPKCTKTVYPTEKLNCLDKAWHKSCFRCETCNLLLSMKTYKGYNGIPYCNTHYPTTKFTAVADTPENRRIAKNTSQQSNVEYNKQFEATKGQFTSVADDPETLRAKKVGQQRSDIHYQDKPAQGEAPLEEYTPQPEPSFPPPSQPPPVPEPDYPAGGNRKSGQNSKTATFDYTAADDDEVSFSEGDLITDVVQIDEGWCEGTVDRTGERGMIPANYLE